MTAPMSLSSDPQQTQTTQPGNAHGVSELLSLTLDYLTDGQREGQVANLFRSQFRHAFQHARLDDQRKAARLLAQCTNLPYDILMLLICGDEEVAAPLLSCSNQLDEAVR